jgi:hypothetical protein
LLLLWILWGRRREETDPSEGRFILGGIIVDVVGDDRGFGGPVVVVRW